MNYKHLILSATVSAITLAAVTPAFADTNCQSIYGGGQTCGSGNFTVEKQVYKPGTNNVYVDNLTPQDPAYQPNAPIFFKITVKNTSNATLNNVVIKDTIDPTQEFVAFSNVIDNSAATYDDKAHIVTYTIPSLAAGQENSIIIGGKTVPAAQLPVNTTSVCPTNIVTVTADNNSPTQATSEFCIANPAVTTNTVPVVTTTPAVQVYPAAPGKTTPGTGPESLPLLAMIPTAGIGFWLRKKAK